MTTRTFFADLVARGPLLVYGDRAFLTNQDSSNYLEFKSGERIGLVPAGDLSDLVRFYYNLNQKEIYAFKKNFVEARFKNDFETVEDRKKEIGKRKLFHFIVKELMPFMSGHKEDLSDLLGEEIKKQKIEKVNTVKEEDLIKALGKIKNDLKEEQYKKGGDFKRYENNPAGYFSYVLGGDMISLEGTVCHLERNNKSPDFLISIKGKEEHFKFGQTINFSQIEENVLAFLKWSQELEAIDEFSDYIKEKQKIRLSVADNFDEIIKLKEFNDGDIGFLQKGNEIYVYQIIPPFAMLDPRPTKKGICYEFPRLRVGMEIEHEYDKLSLREPLLFEPEWHPFVDNKGEAFQHICGGHVPNKGEFKSEVEWAAKALDDAKNVIMHGLTPESIRQHAGDTTRGGNYFGTPLDTKLQGREIKIDEAKRKGLLITNKWKWKDGYEDDR